MAGDAVLVAIAWFLAFQLRFLDEGGSLPSRYQDLLIYSIGFVVVGKVAVFYAKYHILPVEERHALTLRLKHTQTEWGRCATFQQQHVVFIAVLKNSFFAA